MRIVIIFGLACIIICNVIVPLVSYFTSKKKIKDKRIGIRVEFVHKHDATNTPIIQIFDYEDDLVDCMPDILLYAKQHHLQIRSMKQLTTKD